MRQQGSWADWVVTLGALGASWLGDRREETAQLGAGQADFGAGVRKPESSRCLKSNEYTSCFKIKTKKK